MDPTHPTSDLSRIARRMQGFFAFGVLHAKARPAAITVVNQEVSTPMQLSRTVGYALQATLQLAAAESSSPIPCSQLAAEGRMPGRFLLQILRNLVTHGILQSVRGVDGGYTLERKPEEISLLEIIEAVDGPLMAGAPVSEGLPHESQTKLREALEQVTATSRRQLSEIKVASLLKQPGA